MSSLPADTATLTDAQLAAALRNGDDAAFRMLLERYHAALLQLAQSFVSDASVADAVVREALGEVLLRLDTFDDARSSLSVWLFGIVINRARARSPVAEPAAAESLGPAVDPTRFRGPEDQYHGGWRTFPGSWGEARDQQLGSPEALARMRNTLDSLPRNQRQVVVLRDVLGCTAAEVSDLLGISDTLQRPLLHHARTRVREALASLMTGK
jgi:RNA polymerase sigma-70 factor, ECF subfamily